MTGCMTHLRGAPRRLAAAGLTLALLAAPAFAEAPESWQRAFPQTDFSQHAVPYDEIRSGGVPKDGIPSIDDPKFAPVDARRDWLADREPVIGLSIDGEARAYPLRILTWHEIVNDTVGGTPVAVTYCPLCNAAIVFEATVDGRRLTFGTTGKLRHSDLVMYDRRSETWWQQFEGRAIVGTMAGRLTESGKVGYVGSFPIPEVIRGINSTAVHLRKVNPEATVTPIWVNSWYDPGKEAEAARALIDQGIDVITQHTDSPAPAQVAEERGLPCFGQASDMRRFAPNSQVTAIVDDWNPYYVRRVGEVLDGTWRSTDTWAGIGEGMVVVADYGPMATAAMIEEAEDLKARIAGGDYHPFTGPITAQDGTVLVAEGEIAGDEQLLGMSTYAEGVIGSIPG